MTEGEGERPLSPPLIYRSCLSELPGHFLEVRCGCGHASVYPFLLLIRKLGAHRKLGEISTRIKCKRCRAVPAAVFLNTTPNRLPCHGAPPGPSRRLFPPEPAETDPHNARIGRGPAPDHG